MPKSATMSVRALRMLSAVGLVTVLAMSLLRCGAVDAPANQDVPRPTIDVPKATVTPLLTAKADDPAWKQAAVIPSLPLMLGDDYKALKPLGTEVRLLWDAENFYVRFICEDNELFLPHPGTKRDAPYYDGDVAEVFIDPKGDGKQYVELEVSPENGVFDQLILLTTELQSKPDLVIADSMWRDLWFYPEWTMEGLRTAATITPSVPKVTRWIVDMAIPAKTLLKRLGTEQYADAMTMRVNFLRYEEVAKPGTMDRIFLPMNWAPTIGGCPHISPAAYGYVKLVGKATAAK